MARPREFNEDQVIDAAMNVFWRRGYAGTAAQDLVDATGLGRSSLYAVYGSKRGIFEQALLRYRKHTQIHLNQLQGTGSAIESLRELMFRVVDADSIASEKRGCLATNSAIELARDPSVANLVRGNFDTLLRGIEEIIRCGQNAGEIRSSGDAEALAYFVFNAMQGLNVLNRVSSAEDSRKLMNIIELTLLALK